MIRLSCTYYLECADQPRKHILPVHRSIVRNLFVGIFLCLTFLFSNIRFCVLDVHADPKDYYRLVILGDPHLPGKEVPAKEDTLKTINSWNDVDRVVVLGDICYGLGTRDEYAYARRFFSPLKKPVCFINGNHDYIYDDVADPKDKKTKASADIRERKLRLFKETFNLPELYYSIKAGNYFLIFLSADDLESNDLVRISEGQLNWLRSALDRNKEFPTLLFSHAPLKGTLYPYNERVNTTHYVIQPEERIRELIRQNPQIFLWVSGHTHTPATSESYASEINLYEKQVTNIHTCDMNRKTIWTNSLYLYPEKVFVRTFDHRKGTWMNHLERIILPPGRQP